jgi:hypothetical protein
MSQVIINSSKKYAKYLSKHLQKEHPTTKGHVKVNI